MSNVDSLPRVCFRRFIFRSFGRSVFVAASAIIVMWTWLVRRHEGPGRQRADSPDFHGLGGHRKKCLKNLTRAVRSPTEEIVSMANA